MFFESISVNTELSLELSVSALHSQQIGSSTSTEHSYVISFRERETVKEMVGSNVEIMRYSGYIREVTKETFYSSFVPSPHHIL